MREEYSKLNRMEMSIWQCCELLNEVVDDSDPDLDVLGMEPTFNLGVSVFPKETSSGFSGVEAVEDLHSVGCEVVQTFRNGIDDQDDTNLSKFDLNNFRPMSRDLFVGGEKEEQLNSLDDEQRPTRYATQPKEQFQIPTKISQRYPRHNASQRGGLIEFAWMSKLEKRTKVLEMAMGRIFSRLIPNDPLIPLLNRGEQSAKIATRNSLTLSNVVVSTKPKGSGKSNLEPSSSKHNEELMRKNEELEMQLKDI
ncbi:hypothetical protein SLEP1_g23062 [Rubroshorea leprosula]|uniref:Inositol oxygenase n=1 Tax=Rubroshorea leprosula TaxID=152421 RepID=A0AAV5JB29_9ROSI|nr:hypothetical protein SLEP1_g23062 [Rubroshorea leprosula]